MRLEPLLLATLAGLSLGEGAAAHHAATPVYDVARTVTVEGVVREFRLVNPHAMMTLAVGDEASGIVTWTVELDGRTNLTAYGWKESSIVVGERVNVTGNPTHTGSPRLFFQALTRPDGTLVQRPFNAFFGAGISEEIRQRREQRARQGIEGAKFEARTE